VKKKKPTKKKTGEKGKKIELGNKIHQGKGRGKIQLKVAHGETRGPRGRQREKTREKGETLYVAFAF